MTFKTFALAGAALFCAAALSQPVLALQTEWIATGTVSGSSGFGDLFGSNDLDGDSFTAVVYIDTSVGQFSDYGGGNQRIDGGSDIGAPAPFYTTLTINGRSQSTSLAVYSAYIYIGNTYPFVYNSALQDQGTGVTIGVFGDEPSMPGFPTAFGQPFSIDVDGVNVTNNSGFSFLNASGAYESGVLDITNLSSPGVVSSAPEPAAWALMLAGVGGIGLMLRRGRVCRRILPVQAA